MRRANQQNQDNNIVETKLSKCDHLSGDQYSATAQLSRYRDEDSYKGGNFLYFSIKNKTQNREVAFYTNGNLSYDTSDKNALSVIKDLEVSCDKNIDDPKDWTPIPREDIAGKQYDPKLDPKKHKHPWHTEKATSQSFEPSINHDQYLKNEKQKQLLDKKKKNAQDISGSKHPDPFKKHGLSKTSDHFTDATRKRAASELNKGLEKTKRDEKQRDPSHTPEHKRDRSR